MRVLDQGVPLVARQRDAARVAAGEVARAAAPVREGARIARVLERAKHPAVAERGPYESALRGPGADPPGEEQTLFTEVPHGRRGRAGAGEGTEEGPHRLLHLLVGVEHDRAARILDEPDRQGHLELAARGLGALAADEAR